MRPDTCEEHSVRIPVAGAVEIGVKAKLTAHRDAARRKRVRAPACMGKMV
jgi:hypothetical protein